MAQKIKKGDEVVVIAGKDKGKRGVILQVKHLKDKRLQKDRMKILVEGINMIKKHVKPNPNKNEPGGIKEIETYIDVSNVMLFNPIAKKGDRVGFRILDDGKKVRYFKSSGEIVETNK